MSILFLLYRYPGFGGIEKVTECLAKELSKEHSVTVFSVISEHENVLANRELHGISRYTLADFGNKSLPVILKDILDKHCVDIVVYQDNYAECEDEVFEAIGKAAKKPRLIVAEHNSPDCHLAAHKLFDKHPLFLKSLSYLKKRLEVMRRHRKMLLNGNQYVVLSERYVEVLKRVSRLDVSAKVVAINNPITESFPDQQELMEKEKVCLFAGRLVQEKGVGFLADIWEEISKRHPDWHLQILGDGEKRSWLEQRIEEKQLGNVVLDGFCSDITPYLKKSSILLMPSVFEGWPLTIGEAMAYGCVPVAFASFEASYDMIDDGENGLLIAPYDTKAFIERLDGIMNENKLSRMRKGAVEKAGKFHISRILPQWEKLFEEVMQ